MAVTKILARKGSVRDGLQYILNPDKTEERILTAYLNCDPGMEADQMMQTKKDCNNENGVQYYHIIQSFKPREITPELALEIATEFAEEHLGEYEVVIATHVDRGHIHSHLIMNSVNAVTGKKYVSTPGTYYRQIRSISDRLCREHGLSVIMEGEKSNALSYIEWLRQSRGQPTFKSMLEADLREAIEDANDLGHFFMLMEHKGYEIKHGKRLSFRLRGQERYLCPGRRDPLFTEEGIKAAIEGNLQDIEAGRKPAIIQRPRYQPYRRHPKYTGLLALYWKYLYLLDKVEKRQYSPRMTAHLRREVMKFEKYREQFEFLRENCITSSEDMTALVERTHRELAGLMKQRTILNVRKKRRSPIYTALAEAETLRPVKKLCEERMLGVEAEYRRYMDAEKTLNECGIPREKLLAEKAAVYEQLSELNRQIKAVRKKLNLCKEIQTVRPQMVQDISAMEPKERTVTRDERRWR